MVSKLIKEHLILQRSGWVTGNLETSPFELAFEGLLLRTK